MHRPERREERAGLLGRDLGDLAGRPAQDDVGEGGKPLVFAGAQAEGEDPAGAVAGRVDVRTVGREASQQPRIVLPRLAQEGPELGVGLVAGRGREDAGAGIGRPARVRGVDDGDRCAQAGQLVGEREADETGADHGHVVSMPVHEHRVHQARRRRASGGSH